MRRRRRKGSVLTDEHLAELIIGLQQDAAEQLMDRYDLDPVAAMNLAVYATARQAGELVALFDER